MMVLCQFNKNKMSFFFFFFFLFPFEAYIYFQQEIQNHFLQRRRSEYGAVRCVCMYRFLSQFFGHFDKSVNDELDYGDGERGDDNYFLYTASSTEEGEYLSYSDSENHTNIKSLNTKNTYFRRIPPSLWQNEIISLQTYYHAFCNQMADMDNLHTPNIYINKDQRAVALSRTSGYNDNQQSDTFLVKKITDYIYSYIIDDIIQSITIEQQQTKTEIVEKRRLLIQRTSFCDEEHQLCPNDYIIYTKVNSKFYNACQEKIKYCSILDFNRDVIPISPHLRHFLCDIPSDGTVPLTTGKRKIGNDAWVSLPSQYLLFFTA